MIPVVWLQKRGLCWDQMLLNDTLSGAAWPTGYEFDHREGLDALAGPEGAVVVIPGAAEADRADHINDTLAQLPWVFVIVTSDEERRFPIDRIQHPNMRLWLQYPRRGDKAHGYLPTGYTPHLRPNLTDQPRTYDWSFAGQVNNTRRKEAAETLRGMPNGHLIETPGFTQGLDRPDYVELLCTSRFVPCPSGPQSNDSFRVWEALEAGAIPVADARTPAGDAEWLWGLVTPGYQFPTIQHWQSLPDIVDAWLPDWDTQTARIGAWWQGWKRRFAQRIGDTIHTLSGTPYEPGPVTVLIPTSPIASHPDTAIIEQTIASVRHWLPDAEIIVMCDGLRAEQEHYRARYDQYLQRLTSLTGRSRRIVPIIHDGHLHQAEMTRRALEHVRTPLVLFVEHDTPLVTDCDIDFPALAAAVTSGEVDMVRFHYEGRIHPEHEHLMLDTQPRDVHGVPLIRTVQWSQRPHLANTGFYRRILTSDFPAGHVGMIEDVMHGVVHNAWRDYGKAGWDRYRLAVYAPPGPHIKRSDHLDGRGDDPKWPDS